MQRHQEEGTGGWSTTAGGSFVGSSTDGGAADQKPLPINRCWEGEREDLAGSAPSVGWTVLWSCKKLCLVFLVLFSFLPFYFFPWLRVLFCLDLNSLPCCEEGPDSSFEVKETD